MYRPWLQTIDLNKRILEVGPLTNPVISKISGKDNVCYADICSTEELKEFYKFDSYVDTNAIVSVDYVIKDSYSKSLQDVEPFDYVIMSHVIEHIPQLINFFQDIATVLRPDGKLCLSIPDKRYCFDHFRQPTFFAECYDIYRKGIPDNTIRVLDQLYTTSINDPVFWWQNPGNYEYLKNEGEWGLDAYEAANSNKFHSTHIHYSVFTPETFLLLVFYLTRYALFPFKIVEFYGTEENTFEFNVVLEKRFSLLDNAEERAMASSEIVTLLADNMDNKIYARYDELKQTVERGKLEAERLREEKTELQKHLDGVLNSKSWRITKPLRELLKIFRRGRNS
jgi:SAM-dependent methyltransferase